jgi:hypothetical protein
MTVKALEKRSGSAMNAAGLNVGETRRVYRAPLTLHAKHQHFFGNQRIANVASDGVVQTVETNRMIGAVKTL